MLVLLFSNLFLLYNTCMKTFIMAMLQGMGSVLTVNSTALYRHPHRQSGEALRGDWLRIGQDIENAWDNDDDK